MFTTMKTKILRSRLGSCWKCMTFSSVMLVACVLLVFLAATLDDQDGETVVGDGWLILAMAGAVLFSLLSLAHLLTFLLRKSVWRHSV